MSAQTIVGKAIAKRGYESRYAGAHVVKAYLKMVEEVCELGKTMPLADMFTNDLAVVGNQARSLFDTLVRAGPAYCPPVKDVEDLASELADVQVTVFDMANGLSRLMTDDFDVVQAAVDKATADIERGVRT